MQPGDESHARGRAARFGPPAERPARLALGGLVLSLAAAAVLGALPAQRGAPPAIAFTSEPVATPAPGESATACSGRAAGGARGKAVLLPVRWVRADQESLRSDRPSAWSAVPAIEIRLNPPPDVPADTAHTRARVTIAETGDMLFVRLQWNVAPRRRAAAPSRHATAAPPLEGYSDAACVMVPRAVGSLAALPSIAMGEAGAIVDLYSWHERRGFTHLQAAGPGTLAHTGQNFPGHARRTPSGWSVVFQLPVPPPRTPIAFAVWDPRRGHHGGTKSFSPWYEIWFD